MNYLISSVNLIVNAIILSLIIFNNSFAQISDTSNNSSDETEFKMTKSPWGAVARSAVIPGLGQFYNESYWKIPLIWGTAAWLVYNWADNNKLYSDYKSLYQNTNNEYYRRLRNFYRDQRDKFTIYLGLLYLLNLVDAYVDAHLFDFNVGENFNGNDFQINLRINLP